MMGTKMDIPSGTAVSKHEGRRGQQGSDNGQTVFSPVSS